MKYLKTLALLISLSTLSVLTSCSEDAFEDFPSDVYSSSSTDTSLETKAAELNDSTSSGLISIHIDEPNTVNVDYTITIP